jgi:hypothetical protein
MLRFKSDKYSSAFPLAAFKMRLHCQSFLKKKTPETATVALLTLATFSNRMQVGLFLFCIALPKVVNLSKSTVIPCLHEQPKLDPIAKIGWKDRNFPILFGRTTKIRPILAVRVNEGSVLRADLLA